MAALAGCGWTARDDLYDRRSISVNAGPGDGSRITWAEPERPWQVRETRVQASETPAWQQ